MAGESDLSIRLKALDGQWETVGADRLRGIVPQNFQATANEWGSDTCSFVLRRSTGAVHPDLTAFTPCRVDVAGVKVWSGRVKETPTQDGTDETITVQGEGKQYHLDDDVYERVYVHTRLSDWRDVRSFMTAPLGSGVGRFPAGYQVEASNGAITLTFPKGMTIAQFEDVGVQLDLGEATPGAMSVAYEYESSANDVNTTMFVFASDTEAPQSGDFDSVSSFTVASTSGSAAGFATVPRRYISFVLQRQGAPVTLGGDIWVRLTAIRVYTDDAWRTGGLFADDVVNDAVDRSTLLLSSDRSQVVAGTFAIQEYAPSGAQSPREVISAINAYENYDTKIDVDDRICFRPRPVAPIYEIGEWAGADFADASANSGDDMFSRVLVQGTGPDGSALSVDRVNTDGPWLPDPVPTVPNFGFETNTTGWTVVFGTLTRDTAVKQAGLASGRMNSDSGANAAISTTITGLTVGAVYLIQMDLRRATAFLGSNAMLQTGAQIVEFTNAQLPVGTFVAVGLVFRALTTSHLFQLRLDTINSTEIAAYVDNVRIFRSGATLVDRRRFRRTKILPISSAITTTVGQRLGDLYLEAHKTTPFRGGFKATGRGGVRRVLGGGGIHPAWLLRDTGQLVRCSHRADPDNGSWTRSGRMATVSYDHDSQTATVALDEDREGFEALLARLALVTG